MSSTSIRNPLPIAAAILAVTSVGAGLSLSMPLLSMLFEQRGISGHWIGVNTATAGLAAIVAGPTITPMAQKFGVVRSLTTLLVTASVSLVSIYLVDSFLATFPLRFVFHAAITGIIILSEFWINAEAPPERRGFFLGLYTTMLSIGFVIGPVILQATGIEGPVPFVIGAAVILAAAVPVLAAASHAPQLGDEPEAAWWRFIFLSPLAMGAVLVFGVAESGLLSLFPVYGLRLGYTPEIVATFLIAMGAGNVLFQIPIGLLIDRASKRALIVLFSLAGLAGAIALPIATDSVTAMYAVIFFWGGVIPGLYTLGLAQLGTQYSGANLAAANAAFVMVYSFGNLVGPPSIGTGMEIWNPHGAMWVIAAGFGLLSVFAIGTSGQRALSRRTRETA
ncbi:MFS transporter [Hoeflea sp. TYP-13]|uniref:MFS transporter n=1 Tax=Hoeflea sp. TYP-13 TaxID=3230023 RepID=UPI0034C687C0